MKEYCLSFEFGFINIPDIEVSEVDFFKVITALGEKYDIYHCDNTKISHYFLLDYYGDLLEIGYVRRLDCE